jgi:hypothetical protein
MKNLLLIACICLFASFKTKNTVVAFITAQTGYSDVPGTFQNNALPTSANIVTIRPGDTLKVRNHFYCKDIVFQSSGETQSVLQCANPSFIHKGHEGWG